MLIDGADRDFIDNHTADVEILADAVADLSRSRHTARLADIAEADLISL